jgi:anti-sigma-K factor RskA
MNCDEVRPLLELYALDVLDPEERADVAEHLQTNCAGCAEALSHAVALNAAILAAVPDQAPPASLRKKVIGLVRPARPSWLLQVVAGLAAALAFAAVWLGIDNRGKSEQLAREGRVREALESELVRAEAALAFLRDPETRPASASRPDQPSGTYFINPKSGVLLIASRLPALRTGQTYQMWVIPKRQSPQPAGLFRPDDSGGAVHLQTGPLDPGAVQAFAITVEPEGGSPAPTTTPMLVSPVAE